MKANKLAIALAALGTCAAIPALSQDRYYPNDNRYNQPYDNRYENRYDSRDNGRYRDDVARVIDSQPVAGSGELQECWNPRAGHYEEVHGPDKARIVSKDSAIGAVAGGVIGHEVGNGAAATIGGALLGGLAGHAYEQHENNQQTQDDLDRSRCRVVQSGDQQYDVRYTYRGREYTARLDHPPGPTLALGHDIDDEGEPYHKP